jgi:hypothetical protein
MYDYQIGKKQHRVAVSGDAATLRSWLANQPI